MTNSNDVRSLVRAALEKNPAEHVARVLGASLESTLRLAAHAEVRPGTVALAEARRAQLVELATR